MRTGLLLSALLLPASAKTLYEHEYGQHGIDAGMDDGEVYDPTYQQEGDPAKPGFAQSHFLTADAAGPDHAKCLDGTPPVYYHIPGWGDGADKWFIHQQGGGWCYSIEDCVGRSKGSLGSTSKDPKTRTLGGGYFAYDNTTNPLMWNWNKIEIRYCDGASVSGDRVDQEPSSKLWFRGRAILDAEIKSILNDRGMNNATDVIVSGCSAGGLATFLHCDYWAAAIGKATTAMTGTGAQVACVPDSGFFLDEERSPKYHSKMKNVYKFPVFVGGLERGVCRGAQGRHRWRVEMHFRTVDCASHQDPDLPDAVAVRQLAVLQRGRHERSGGRSQHH